MLARANSSVNPALCSSWCWSQSLTDDSFILLQVRRHPHPGRHPVRRAERESQPDYFGRLQGEFLSTCIELLVLLVIVNSGEWLFSLFRTWSRNLRIAKLGRRIASPWSSARPSNSSSSSNRRSSTMRTSRLLFLSTQLSKASHLCQHKWKLLSRDNLI